MVGLLILVQYYKQKLLRAWGGSDLDGLGSVSATTNLQQTTGQLQENREGYTIQV